MNSGWISPAFAEQSLGAQICAGRSELFAAIGASDPQDRTVALLWIGDLDPAGRRLRAIETIRRYSQLSGICRPVAAGATHEDLRMAEAAGAYAFIWQDDPALNSEALTKHLASVASRVPRNLAHSRGPFVEIGEPVARADLAALDEIQAEIFARTFGFEPSSLDMRIVRAWGRETPDKVLVEEIGSDPNSGWSGSAVSRRIEKLRENAPVLFRDAVGNLAKVRLAQQFGNLPPGSRTDLMLEWPDIDRCIAMSADDELIRDARIDDDARFAFEALVSRRYVEAQRAGGRPKAGSRVASLAEDVRSAFDSSFTTRFANELEFQAAAGRALFAIADAQLDTRGEMQLDDYAQTA